MTRSRLRDLGITIGTLPPGPHNAITDVPGVLVGHATIVRDEPTVARTGVTVIAPHGGQSWEDHVFAAAHSFNGFGEMTGLLWLAESGLLSSPVVLTSTLAVGTAYEAMQRYPFEHGFVHATGLPVVGETYDGYLNDLSTPHVTRAHIHQAIAALADGPVPEGNVGGGTGMICHEFKGGIGTSSRLVACENGTTYVVGALVQANYGARADLCVAGVPVGREIGPDQVPQPGPRPLDMGSIVIVVGTDAPLLPLQCRRLAQRATLGLARAGGVGHNRSGDIFLAFATGNHLPVPMDDPYPLYMLPHGQMNPFFGAVAEAVEESIINALTAAETTTGAHGRMAHALPLDTLQTIMRRWTPESPCTPCY
ncbi:MAG: P1 family peptidase [Chloroflexi bacterium]|nr:P1 family peptidase [Chloroflexota bacterium]